jgi:hypothetical protein
LGHGRACRAITKFTGGRNDLSVFAALRNFMFRIDEYCNCGMAAQIPQ